MSGRTQNSLMLEALADGQWHSDHELRETAFTGRPNSRAAELRKLGYDVRCGRVKDAAGRTVYGYELVAVPAVAPAIERTVPEPTVRQLEELRLRRRDDDESGPTLHADAGPDSSSACHAGAPIGHSGERAAVAQLGERDVANVEVAGSRPASRFESPSLFDAPAAPARGEGREYQQGFVCRPDLEVELELRAIERELDDLQNGFMDSDRYEVLTRRRVELEDRLLGGRAA